MSMQKVQQHVFRRLQEMERHNWTSMDCEGKLTVVGEAQDLWTQKELRELAPRVDDLALDPARGTKISEGGMEEAAVAFTAENLEIFERLERETTGSAEFVDENGVKWDVKSPLSPPKGQHWEYSAHHQLTKIRHDFEQGDRVLLNLTRLNQEDLGETVSLLQSELTCQERGQLLILSDRDTPTTLAPSEHAC